MIGIVTGDLVGGYSVCLELCVLMSLWYFDVLEVIGRASGGYKRCYNAVP